MLSFRSKVTRQIIPYLLLNPHAELYLNEMVGKFGVDRGNLVKKLAEWEREGVLLKRKLGRLSLYRANVRYPLYHELKAITQKQFGLEEALRSSLRQVTGISQVYIFGSYAKGVMGGESDIDVLVVGSHQAVAVQRKLVAIQKKFDREINVVDMTSAELARRKRAHDPLIKQVFNQRNIKLL